MWKYFTLFLFCVTCNAAQTKEQIINYCKKEYLKDGGNITVLLCIEEELKAQNRIEEIARNK